MQTLWLVHDVVLGSFWFYLAFMLYDLTDDQDDSEWRTIFLSMLSWHIIIIVLYQCYFKTMWSLYPYTPLETKSKPCCSPQQSPKIWSWIRIASFIGVYIVIILRIQKDNLLSMQFESLLHAVIASILVALACLSYLFPKVERSTKTSSNQFLKGTELLF